MVGLELAPKAINRMLAKLDPAKFDSKTGQDRFTVRESIAHLADWEPIFLHRIQTALNSPGGDIEDLDEGEIAIAGEYFRRDPISEGARFAEGRAAIIAFLNSLKPEEWGHTVVHPVRGSMTIYDWANCIVGHDVYHIEYLTEFLD